MLCCSPLSSGINHTSLFRRDVFRVGIGGEAGLTHQIGDNRQAVVRFAHTRKRHAVARQESARVLQPVIDLVGRPDEVGLLQGRGIGKALQCAGLATEQPMQVRANEITAAFRRNVAGLAELPGAATARIIGGIVRGGQGRER